MDGTRLITRAPGLHARLYFMTYRMVCRALPPGSPNHTLTLVLLTAFGALILLTLVHVLWLMGVVPDPYQPSALGAGHGWVWSVLVLFAYANLLLGRQSFRAINSGCFPG